MFMATMADGTCPALRLALVVAALLFGLGDVNRGENVRGSNRR